MSRIRKRSNDDDAVRRIAYVMTHYPYPSQTFLMEEVLGVEGDGLHVAPIAINPAAESDMLTDELRHERDRTFYVKSLSLPRLVLAITRRGWRHPLRLAGVFARAMRSAGTDLRLALWRAFHVAEGVVVWDHCRRSHISHLHAQFGGMPAAVAMYAAEVAARVDGRDDVTWSYTVHGYHDFMNEREIRLDVKTASATMVVCISDFIASQVMRVAAPEDWSKVHVVRCGIALDRFPMRPSRPVGERAVVLTVGRLSTEKGQLVLLHAMRLLADRGRDVELRVIGSGPLDEMLRAERDRLDLGERVVMLGLRPSHEVAAELLASDVFCLPSFAEGLPISIMEAMAVGVPVVSTSVGGITELVTTGESGWCTAPGRADLIADALELAITEGETRDRVIAEARRRVEDAHDTVQSARAMRKLLLGIVAA
ncbi:MAG TPA: glycosyltransferase family 4 protein [Ilumatobacteraceae bacterium]